MYLYATSTILYCLLLVDMNVPSHFFLNCEFFASCLHNMMQILRNDFGRIQKVLVQVHAYLQGCFVIFCCLCCIMLKEKFRFDIWFCSCCIAGRHHVTLFWKPVLKNNVSLDRWPFLLFYCIFFSMLYVFMPYFNAFSSYGDSLFCGLLEWTRMDKSIHNITELLFKLQRISNYYFLSVFSVFLSLKTHLFGSFSFVKRLEMMIYK